MRARCEAHGLAVGDDGACVLCRADAAEEAAVSRAPGTRRGGGRALALGATATLALLGAAAGLAGGLHARVAPRAASALPAPAPSSQWVSEIAPDGGDRAVLAALAQLVDETSVLAERQRSDASPRSLSGPRPIPSSPEALAAAREAAERAAKERALRARQAEYEAWAHREATKDIAEDEAHARRVKAAAQTESGATGAAARAAADGPPAWRTGTAATSSPKASPEERRRVPLTMYSASWCGVCKTARSYLIAAQIPFTEREVDTDVVAAAEARRLNPRGSVPTFDVAGTTIIGFRPNTLEAAIDAAAARAAR